MTERKRVLSPAELMPQYEELLKEGAELPLTVSGSSMTPFLHPDRDTVYIKQIENDLKKGDIVFFRRNDGSYVLHRVIRLGEGGMYLAGDAQDCIEGPVEANAAFAVVTGVIRNGKRLGPGDACWEFFEHIWLRTVGRRRKIFRII